MYKFLKAGKYLIQMINKPDLFVHESSYVDENVLIGEGLKYGTSYHIQSGASIGNHCTIGQNVNIGTNAKIGIVKIQNNVSVYEGAELEDYVFCGPLWFSLI